jgi:hypothetical protein
MEHQPLYEEYLKGQFREIMEQYRPDGMWLDWYWLIMMWLVPKAQGKMQTILTLIYLVVALAIWFPLSRAHWAYYLTASSF